MALEQWPTVLQEILNEANFQLSFGDTVVRSSMSEGPPKVRKVSTAPIDSMTCSIDVEKTDYITFKNFFNTTLAGGSLNFEFNDPISEAPSAYRFSSRPTVSSLGAGYYRVGMEWIKLYEIP